MNDKEELVNSIQNIRSRFKTELEDPDQEKMSFFDELNNLIRKIFKDDPIDVYTTLSPGELEKWKKRRFKRWIVKYVARINITSVLYFLLLSTITGFLVSEAVSFYAVENASEAKTWLKAILTEVCFIFLSGYRSTGTGNTLYVNTLRVGMFCLMLFVITSSVVFNSVTTTSESNNISEQVSLIEQQIKDKQTTIDFYKGKNWGGSVNKHEQQKQELIDKLIKLKEEQGKGKTSDVSDVVRYQMYGRAAFRIMLMLISVLITRRLFKF